MGFFVTFIRNLLFRKTTSTFLDLLKYISLILKQLILIDAIHIELDPGSKLLYLASYLHKICQKLLLNENLYYRKKFC